MGPLLILCDNRIEVHSFGEHGVHRVSSKGGSKGTLIPYQRGLKGASYRGHR